MDEVHLLLFKAHRSEFEKNLLFFLSYKGFLGTSRSTLVGFVKKVSCFLSILPWVICH